MDKIVVAKRFLAFQQPVTILKQAPVLLRIPGDRFPIYKIVATKIGIRVQQDIQFQLKQTDPETGICLLCWFQGTQAGFPTCFYPYCNCPNSWFYLCSMVRDCDMKPKDTLEFQSVSSLSKHTVPGPNKLLYWVSSGHLSSQKAGQAP